MRQNRATPELCPDQGSATIAHREMLKGAAAIAAAVTVWPKSLPYRYRHRYRLTH